VRFYRYPKFAFTRCEACIVDDHVVCDAAFLGHQDGHPREGKRLPLHGVECEPVRFHCELVLETLHVAAGAKAMTCHSFDHYMGRAVYFDGGMLRTVTSARSRSSHSEANVSSFDSSMC
jgi:hypothetical protein